MGSRPMAAAGPGVAAAGPEVAAAGPDVAAAGPDDTAAGPEVAAAAGPDVVVVAVVAVAAAGAVPLPTARKITRNNRGQCVEETDYKLGKEGHRAAKPHSYVPVRNTLSTLPFGSPWSPGYDNPE